MMIQQASHSWIGWIVIFGFFAVLLLGILLAQTILPARNEPVTFPQAMRTPHPQEPTRITDNAAMATTTAASLNATAAALGIHVTATVVAVSINATATFNAQLAVHNQHMLKATETAAGAGAEQTATAVAVLNDRMERQDAQNAKLYSTSVTLAAFVVAGIILAFTVVVAYHFIAIERARATELEVQRLEQATRLAEAEAACREQQAQMLKEQRRNTQMGVSSVMISQSGKDALTPSRIILGNGNGRAQGT